MFRAVQRKLVQATFVGQFRAQQKKRLALFHLGLVEDHMMDVVAGTLEDQTKGNCGVQQGKIGRYKDFNKIMYN